MFSEHDYEDGTSCRYIIATVPFELGIDWETPTDPPSSNGSGHYRKIQPYDDSDDDF